MKKCDRCNGTGYIGEALPSKDVPSLETGDDLSCPNTWVNREGETVDIDVLTRTTWTEVEEAEYYRRKALTL